MNVEMEALQAEIKGLKENQEVLREQVDNLTSLVCSLHPVVSAQEEKNDSNPENEEFGADEPSPSQGYETDESGASPPNTDPNPGNF
jgi:hypothetical protein